MEETSNGYSHLRCLSKEHDSIYIRLPGVTGIVDNMIFYSKTELEHDTNLILFLETNRK